MYRLASRLASRKNLVSVIIITGISILRLVAALSARSLIFVDSFSPFPSLPTATSIGVAAAVEHLPFMVAWLDERLTLRHANPAWLTWFDQPDLAAAQSLPLHSLCGMDWLQRLAGATSTATGCGHGSFETEKQDRYGAVRWARVHVTRAQGPGAQPPSPDAAQAPAWLVVMQDITGERARDDIIARQREQLLQNRTELATDQRVRSELEKTRTLLDWRTMMLAERNEMLQLLSHEIRQPLNNASAAMQATTKALSALHIQGEDPAAMALLRAGHVLQQVIGTLDNALAAATVLADGGDISAPGETDLRTPLQMALHDIASDQRDRIDLLWQTDARTVQLHPPLIRLAVRNLLNNALSYSPAGQRVELCISESDQPLAIIIEVRDSGCGIPDALRARLFEKGTRGDHTRQHPGAGLGLFIVHSIMKLHRGTVEALPHLPQGTIMRLTLPQGLED